MEQKPISDSLPRELKQATKLMYQANFDDALNIITNFQTAEIANNEDLSCLILKGKIFCYKEQYKRAVDIGELAYKLSNQLRTPLRTVDALILKAHVGYFGNLEDAFECISEIEILLNTISSESTTDLAIQESELLFLKSFLYHKKTDHNKAITLALQWLSQREKLSEKLDIARVYWHLGEIYLFKSELNTALDYSMKSLELQQQLSNRIGITRSLFLVGLCHFTKGNFDQTKDALKQCLRISETSILTKLETYHLLGAVYKEKGEINRTIRYYNRANKIAEREGYTEQVIINTYGIGATYRMKGDLVQATRYLKRSLEISKEFNSQYGMNISVYYLILTSLDNNSLDQAKLYLSQLEQLTSKTESTIFKNVYLIAKALVLKKGGRIRNRTEAELLLKQIIDKGFETPILYRQSFVNLCELFLEELSITNNLEVLDELNPLINKTIKIAEKQNAYSWLAEINLLQAKLALIQMNFDHAKQLLAQSQRIAEFHGLNLLASKISDEHDKFLEQLNDWESLQKLNAPISERMKLASFDGVVDRMQEKSVVELPEIKREEPVLLLIIAEGGFPLFSTHFGESFKVSDDIISGFLTAFNNFSTELFSKGLDRAKFGEHLILIKPVLHFSVCYIYKGQTFTAKQKVNKFSESIQSKNNIWHTLNNYYKASRILGLKELPSLESLISEIFIY
jgi:tetratricopeptide (TPR) repeat protein